MIEGNLCVFKLPVSLIFSLHMFISRNFMLVPVIILQRFYIIILWNYLNCKNFCLFLKLFHHIEMNELLKTSHNMMFNEVKQG